MNTWKIFEWVGIEIPTSSNEFSCKQHLNFGIGNDRDTRVPTTYLVYDDIMIYKERNQCLFDCTIKVKLQCSQQ